MVCLLEIYSKDQNGGATLNYFPLHWVTNCSRVTSVNHVPSFTQILPIFFSFILLWNFPLRTLLSWIMIFQWCHVFAPLSIVNLPYAQQCQKEGENKEHVSNLFSHGLKPFWWQKWYIHDKFTQHSHEVGPMWVGLTTSVLLVNLMLQNYLYSVVGKALSLSLCVWQTGLAAGGKN